MAAKHSEVIFLNIFGPVPSRRLGRSLGINNIKPKNCTYSCVYCQIGKTTGMRFERIEFYDPEELTVEISGKLNALKEKNEKTDYLTLVADGEPTLDSNLGRLTDELKKFGIKIAIITNASLIGNISVRETLMKYDLVSLKIDSVAEEIWKKTDRPHGMLNLSEIKKGMLKFSEEFEGKLITETMLVKGLNDSAGNLESNAEFIKKLEPDTAYISVPIRPPAENWVKIPSEAVINSAFVIYSGKDIKTELLVGYEGNEFSYTGNVREDILSITAVHPMKEEAVLEYLCKTKQDFSSIKRLIDENVLLTTEYNGDKYFFRKLF